MLPAYEDYAGEDKPQAERIDFRVYTDLDTAYTDLHGGNLDIVDTLPPTALAGDRQDRPR